MVVFDVPQPTVEIAARMENEDKEFLDTFGSEPLSRVYLNSLVTDDDNMDTIEVMDVINEVRDSERFDKYNEDTEIPDEQKNRVTGILFHTIDDDMWYGTYLFEKLDAWGYTVYGETKDEVQNAHALYTSGIKQHRVLSEYTKEEILGIEENT